METTKGDPLAHLKRKLSVTKVVKKTAKFKMAAKMITMARRSSNAYKGKMNKANKDKELGRAGLYRSCRPVHAFDSDANISVTRSWGTSSCGPGDFIVVGEPKQSTNWKNDVYTVSQKEFLEDFQLVPGVFHEYKRTGTYFAWGEEQQLGEDEVPANQGTNWRPSPKWKVFNSCTGVSIRKGDENFTMRHTLFQEAFEPVFVDNPAAHEVMCEVIRILREKNPQATISTLAFRGANTLHVLKPGEVALVTSGQFKVGRMGAPSSSSSSTGRDGNPKKSRRMSFLPTETRLTTKAYMTGESIGPFSQTTEIVTVTELASELFIIDPNIMNFFSEDALNNVEQLALHVNPLDQDAANGIADPAQKLDRACREFFKLCDDDGGGSISPLEFARVLRKQAKKFGPQMKDWFSRPLVIFEQIDEDGSGEIDEEEFVECAY